MTEPHEKRSTAVLREMGKPEGMSDADWKFVLQSMFTQESIQIETQADYDRWNAIRENLQKRVSVTDFRSDSAIYLDSIGAALIGYEERKRSLKLP